MDSLDVMIYCRLTAVLRAFSVGMKHESDCPYIAIFPLHNTCIFKPYVVVIPGFR
jgi:hypothetical protein